MSAPPLPEIFGNYALGEFVEVVPPEAVNWLPQTLGWLCLGIVLLGFAARSGWRKVRHRYRNRYRREAAARLKAFAGHSRGIALVEELNRLLKLVALTAYSRETAASLSGEPWADFLGQQCPVPVFSGQQLALLARGCYQMPDIDDGAAQDLCRAGARWIAEHRGPDSV